PEASGEHEERAPRGAGECGGDGASRLARGCVGAFSPITPANGESASGLLAVQSGSRETVSLAAMPGGLPASGALRPDVGAAPGTRQHAEAGRTAGALPFYFEQNVGQTEGGVDFLARGAGYTLFLTPTEAVLALAGSAGRAGATGRA